MNFKNNLARIIACGISVIALSSCDAYFNTVVKILDPVISSAEPRQEAPPLCPPGTELVITHRRGTFEDRTKGPSITVNQAWNNCFKNERCREKYTGFYQFQAEFERANKNHQSSRGIEYYCNPIK